MLRVRTETTAKPQETEDQADIEQIEDKRPMNKDMDAVYILSPLPHIVDCVMADFERRRYGRSFLIWTSGQCLLHRLDSCLKSILIVSFFSPSTRSAK